mmetsp:Transcript_84955/g.177555  ORF Transcript_84955/g.177555 Transcript_84955/m.177555 type:complete len:418 (+) Transcript_84955:121-1374(+)|eukprot:CAMPEP_0206455126 /NCGR_PEP_ID=MMETSP0324_2-20121206/21564_1 /ASSEMBLY_ACC=CAM_ASM_000836 /TAXON_ID=2866 /ORGANISM="Crypthecodinium cohnii, Strain Seligo" /LENGTH=417 /DNA_ID=CAMNT_0053925765 /DNA_START=101 /DNA_END=1354 /DNA_ORIENTATION=+
MQQLTRTELAALSIEQQWLVASLVGPRKEPRRQTFGGAARPQSQQPPQPQQPYQEGQPLASQQQHLELGDSDTSHELSGKHPTEGLHRAGPWTRLTAGWAAGAVGEVMMHPFSTAQVYSENTVAKRLLRPSLKGLFQSDTGSGNLSEILSVGQTLYRREGLRGLYRGVALPTTAGSLAGAAAFTTYGDVRQRMQEDFGFSRRSSAVLAGSASGVMTAVALSPLEMLTVRMQLSLSSEIASASDLSFQERLLARTTGMLYGSQPMRPIEDVIKRRGVLALWAAIGPTLSREVSYYALYYAAYEEVKMPLVRHGCPEPLAVCAGGGMAGAVGAILSQPVSPIIEARHKELEKMVVGEVEKAIPTRELLKTLIVDRLRSGMPAYTLFTEGLSLSLMRSVPLNAFVFCLYEGLLHSFAGHH